MLRELADVYGICVPESLQTPRKLLRLVNSVTLHADDGLDYLREVFEEFASGLGIDLKSIGPLGDAHSLFFEKAQAALDQIGNDAVRDSESFRKLFRHPAGVVISTCHGVKGEEYDTVIAFGLLKGYIPNWKEIIHNRSGIADDRASKLLFVVCSRAKRRLHLIAESGRFTQKRKEYETTPLLAAIGFDYDPVPSGPMSATTPDAPEDTARQR